MSSTGFIKNTIRCMRMEQLANALDLADPEKIKKHMEAVKEQLV